MKAEILPDDLTKAVRVSNMSRAALINRIATLFAKRRALELEVKELKSAAWNRSGWASEKENA